MTAEENRSAEQEADQKIVEEKAAMKIQSRHRGNMARRRLKTSKTDSEVVSGEERHSTKERKQLRRNKTEGARQLRTSNCKTTQQKQEPSEEEEAAKKIQSMYRGRAARKEVVQKKMIQEDEMQKQRKEQKRNMAIIRLVYKEVREKRADDYGDHNRLSLKILFQDVRRAVRRAIVALKHQARLQGVSVEDVDVCDLHSSFTNELKMESINEGIDERGFTKSLTKVSKHCGLLDDDELGSKIPLGIAYLWQRFLDQANPLERLKIQSKADKLADEAVSRKLRQGQFIKTVGKMAEWLTKEDQPIQYKPIDWLSDKRRAAAQLATLLAGLKPKQAWKAVSRCQLLEEAPEKPKTEEEVEKDSFSLSQISMAKRLTIGRRKKAPSIEEMRQKFNVLVTSLGPDSDEEDTSEQPEVRKKEQPKVTHEEKSYFWKATEQSRAATGNDEGNNFFDWSQLSTDFTSTQGPGDSCTTSMDESAFSRDFTFSQAFMTPTPLFPQEEPVNKESINLELTGDEESSQQKPTNVDAKLHKGQRQKCQVPKIQRNQNQTNRCRCARFSVLQSGQMTHFSLDEQITNAQRCRQNMLLNLKPLAPALVWKLLTELGLDNLRDELLGHVQSRGAGNFIKGKDDAKKFAPFEEPIAQKKPKSRSTYKHRPSPAACTMYRVAPPDDNPFDKAKFFARIEQMSPIAYAVPMEHIATKIMKRKRPGCITSLQPRSLKKQSPDDEVNPDEITAFQLINFLFVGAAGLPRRGWAKEHTKLCSWGGGCQYKVSIPIEVEV